ncbi:MAG: sigma 54-dependent Fis family transcriptional regulator [Holophagales bacterium]|nr:sigma 54-dependent Fis family transcriptional regulator [Holophagales bacterium]MBK9968479.1 sigma 54-dependent Fis family transcriptional regulator [Holophagales bacterium]
MTAKKDTRRWALHVDLEGDVRRVPLEPGETTLGSREDNTVVLAHRSVSKRHAVLRSLPGGFEVEDLGSKNGTRLDGQRVQKAGLSEGSVLSLGPVLLKLERVDEDDLELGIDLGSTHPGHLPALLDLPTRTLGDTGGVQGDRRLALLSRIVRALACYEEGGVSSSLEALREEIGAVTVALLEGRREEDPAVVALRGDPAALNRLAELREVFYGVETSALAPGTVRSFDVPSDPALVGAVGGGAGSGPVLLVAGGVSEPNSDLHLLLQVVLQLLTWTASVGHAVSAPRAELAARNLVFAPGYVPCRSEAMKALYGQLRSLATGDLPVLITGETGVGKEHVARILHASSLVRCSGPFQAVNCAAVPAELLEAELFGVEKGAATGVLARPGQFQLAHRGVLLLDEIGEMPILLQTKLLRVLQSLEVTPVGGRRSVKVDVRIIGATNAEPEQLLREGRLRQDLYYRIAGWTIRVPALRERRDDLPLLLESFVRRFSVETGRKVRGVSLLALRRIVSAPWPGNVRQLEHEVRRLVHLCPDDGVIDASFLPLLGDGGTSTVEPLDDGGDLRLQPRVDDVERKAIRAALARTGGHRSNAAELLGISRDGLRMKMERLGIEG